MVALVLLLLGLAGYLGGLALLNRNRLAVHDNLAVEAGGYGLVVVGVFVLLYAVSQFGL